MSWTIYHNPRCSKSRQTLELLRQHQIEPTVVEYLKNPLSKKELKSLINLLGVPATDVLRGKEKIIKEEGLDVTTSAKALDAMVKYPVLIERPIVVNADKKAVLGRPPENVLALI